MVKRGLLFILASFLLLGTALPVASAVPVASEQWEAVPMVTESIRGAGHPGGEGGQWPLAMATDSQNGSFLMYGTDVGGVYRSLDGGENWEPSNVGRNSRGATAFAIDPNNSKRVLLTAGNSLEMDMHGLYLSTDQGATWKSVLPKSNIGYRDVRDQLAYDPASFDKKLGYSKVAYWSSQTSKKETGRLFKSVDGGLTWKELPNSENYGGSIIKIHPSKGFVYIGGAQGFYRSLDGGKTFTKMLSVDSITGLDVSPADPDKVFLSTADSIYVSTNRGQDFKKIDSSLLPLLVSKEDKAMDPIGYWNLKVSPVNSKHLVMFNGDGDWNWSRYSSKDGGLTWIKGQFDNTYSFIPWNSRPGNFTWHPKQENVIWSFIGDFIVKSTDNGANWMWNNNGNLGIMTGDHWNFNNQNPDLIAFGSQDYSGAMTTNAGATWKYLNTMNQEWGGWSYGGYAVTPKVIVTGDASWDNGWDNDRGGFQRKIEVSRDGGLTFQKFNDIVLKGFASSYSEPTDEKIVFVYEYRSTDQGYTWTKMEGAKGVITSNPKGEHELYGVNNSDVVVSWDKGITWEKVATVPAQADGSVDQISDIALDHVRSLIYIATHKGNDRSNLYQYDMTTGKILDLTSVVPGDQYGNQHTWTVAVDPVNTSVVYAGGPGNVYLTDTSVIRSTDAGKTWQTLTKNNRDSIVKQGLDGAHEASLIRVHPVTRYAYVSGQCFGWWKIAPPGSDVTDVGAAPLLVSEGNGQTTLQWFGNGGPDETLVHGILNNLNNNTILNKLAYDLNGDRKITMLDADIARRAIEELNSAGPLQYEVYRSTSPKGKFVKISGSQTTVTYTDINVKNGVKYYYKVKTVGSNVFTKTATVTPNRKAVAYLLLSVGTDKIELDWEKKSGTYSVYRAVGEGEAVKISEGLTTTRFVDMAVKPDENYRYYITATGMAGISASSTVKSAQLFTVKPE
ncbi:MAG: hypothetical protein H7X86_00780 [Gorillibacterium sp.]|nr:hypothetical protein [Gorillibacterium sp.]